MRSERSRRVAVSEGEGNEARREGGKGVGALRSTVESGEPAPGDPEEGRRCRMMEPLKGKTEETLASESVSTRLQRVAEVSNEAPGMGHFPAFVDRRVRDGLNVLQQVHDMRSRMRESRTSGSVGGGGEQSPSSTRLLL